MGDKYNQGLGLVRVAGLPVAGQGGLDTWYSQTQPVFDSVFHSPVETDTPVTALASIEDCRLV